MDDLTQQVNLALDRVKSENGFASDYQLAKHLGINRMQLTRWRAGKLSKAFSTVAALTNGFTTAVPLGWTEQALDIRILAPLLEIPKLTP